MDAGGNTHTPHTLEPGIEVDGKDARRAKVLGVGSFCVALMKWMMAAKCRHMHMLPLPLGCCTFVRGVF